MRHKLSQIKTPWRRLLITILIHGLLLIGRYASPRARIHWLGHYHRPRRLERALGLLMLLGAVLFLEPHQLVVWSTMWGGFFAIFIILYTIYRFIPCKQYHWIKS